MEYLKLFQLLYGNNVRYLICGGLAMNIYGIPRMTVDIDLLIDLKKENIKSFLAVLDKLKYKPVLPVNLETLADQTARKNLVEKKNLVAYSFYNQMSNYMQLDVLLDAPMTFEEMWKNKVSRKANEFSIYLVSVEHLIKMKEYSNRTQDRDDIVLLTKFKKK